MGEKEGRGEREEEEVAGTRRMRRRRGSGTRSAERREVRGCESRKGVFDERSMRERIMIHGGRSSSAYSTPPDSQRKPGE
jgi:hypothetical protein